MLRFLYNLIRGSGLWFFLVLQFFGIFLVATFNQEQRIIGVNTIKNFTDAGADFYTFITGFSSAKSQLDSLRYENARLRSEISNAKYQDRYRLDTLSTIGNLQRYTFVPAKIVKNSVTLTNNTITIDKGSRHGVLENMGVLGPNGIVGIVRNVTPFYSDVMSILHQRSSISASLRRTGAFGSLVWRSNDPQQTKLTNIPLHVRVEPGDTVQTSGYSSMFPEAIMIGTVSEIEREPGSNFYDLTVRLTQDIQQTRYVYVVRDVLTENEDGE